MNAQIEIAVLGALEVRVAGELRPLPKSRKTRALLAMLALEPRPHDRTTLTDWIWPDTADPRAALRWSLTKLREVLNDGEASLIVTEGDTVRIDFSRASTDRDRVAALLGAGTPDPEAMAAAEGTIARSPFANLGGSASAEFELWLESQRSGVNRIHQQLLGRLIQVAREPAAALEYARKLTVLDPLNTSANARLLELTWTVMGRRQAVQVLEQIRARLTEAGLADTEILARWRDLAGHPRPAEPTAVEAPVAPVSASEEAPLIRALPQKPSVAVLSFEDLGGHGDGAVLAEGISVDLNSRLAQLKGLFVIAGASAGRFSLNDNDPGTIGRQLGVRYLIHGTTRRSDTRLRATVNLIDAEHGSEIWSERIDRPMGDLFEVQDDMANAIVSAIEPQIEQAEMDRARALPTEHLGAWECFHRAMWHSFRFTAEDNRLAAGFFRRALELDGQFARAYAGLSFNHFSRAFLDASDDAAEDIRQALACAEQSVSLDGRDAMGHWALGRALFLHREHDQALGAIDRALIANPNYAQGYYARGFVGGHAGVPEQAIPDLDMALRLSPFDPLLFAIKSSRGIALALQGRNEEAAGWATRATHEPNAHFHIHAVAAACLQLAGQPGDAALNVKRALERHPGYSVRVFERSFPHKNDAHQQKIASALLAAGLPGG